jgi:hypothetical protein
MGLFKRDEPNVIVDPSLMGTLPNKIILNLSIYRKRPAFRSTGQTAIINKNPEDVKKYIIKFSELYNPNSAGRIITVGREKSYSPEILLNDEIKTVSARHGAFLVKYEKKLKKVLLEYMDTSTNGTWISRGKPLKDGKVESSKKDFWIKSSSVVIDDGAKLGFGSMSLQDKNPGYIIEVSVNEEY